LITTHSNILVQLLAGTISDYHRSENAPITTTHIEKWLSQFEVGDQPIILTEVALIMKRFYFSRIRVKECLRNFLRNDVFATYNPATLLPHICFLRIQNKGGSQRAMLDIVDEILREDYRCSIDLAGTSNIKTYFYIDDAVYTGNRLRYDLTSGTNAPSWITNQAPSNCTLLIYTIAVHTEGMNYVEPYILRAAKEKGIIVKWKHSLIIDNSRSLDTKCEALWPEDLSDDPSVNIYVSNLRAFLTRKNWRDNNLFRYGGIPVQEKLFSSPRARRIVERAFLEGGIQIISACQEPKESMRPLGFIKIGSLGFGTFFLTYRNIANNCPLVLWWGVGNWYPLFPRITNEQYEYSM